MPVRYCSFNCLIKFRNPLLSLVDGAFELFEYEPLMVKMETAQFCEPSAMAFRLVFAILIAKAVPEQETQQLHFRGIHHIDSLFGVE